MEFRIGGLALIIIFSSCIQHSDEEAISIQEFSDFQLEIRYAKGFEIEYNAQYTKLTTRSILGNSFFEDSVFLLHDQNFTLLEGSKSIPDKIQSICCQSSTHLAYLDVLSKVQTVSGLCGVKYIEHSPVFEQLNQVEEICLGEAVQTESILSLSPDLYLVYPFASEDVSKLNNQGVKTLMIAEYLEEHPIARLEWIKLYGLLFHKEEAATEYFNNVEAEYFDLVQEIDTNKRFIMNVPYGENWFTPSSNSLIVKLLEDAGFSYYFDQDTGTENTPHSQEEMWETGTKANYWIIIADRPLDFSLDDLIAENEVYSTFKSVKHQQVIFCNSRTSDYFVQGIVEPHILLKDLLYATHKLSDHNPKYFRLLK